ncbi:MAG: 3'-5' exonuclease, partial [Prolixibacteraceae bacterium]|nr:3'-5' exonuclease [Prolixibacteraceae bacterium]
NYIFKILFAIIDIETTGNNYKFGKITEIAIFQHNGEMVTGSFSTLINPEMDIPYFITKLTGITNNMVKDAPKFYEVAKKVIEMTAGRTFVAHNVHFDYRFVKEEFRRLGYEYNCKTLCTVKLYRKFLPRHASYSLGNLCSDLDIKIEGRHRAAGDALATVKLFEIILEKNRLSNDSKSLNNYELF